MKLIYSIDNINNLNYLLALVFEIRSELLCLILFMSRLKLMAEIIGQLDLLLLVKNMLVLGIKIEDGKKSGQV